MIELWPFTNFHDLNLDWIIRNIKRLDKEVEDWKLGLKEYVLELLSDHPEWIQNWMLDENSVKLVNLDAPLANMVSKYDKRIAINDMTESQDYSLQSVCYNNDTDRFLFSFAGDTLTGMLVVCDRNYNVLQRSTATIGHGNDLTYKEGFYYCTRTNGDVSKINANTLQVVDIIHLSSDEIVRFSASKTGFIYATPFDMYACDDMFENVTHLTAMPARPTGWVTYFEQGSTVVFDNNLLTIDWLEKAENPDYSAQLLRLYDESGNLKEESYTSMLTPTDEAEAVLTVDNIIYTYSYTDGYIHVRSNPLQGGESPEWQETIRYTSDSTLLEEVFESLPIYSGKQFTVVMGNEHPTLGGAGGLLETYKYIDGFGFEKFTSSYLSAERACHNNTWSEWRVNYQTDTYTIWYNNKPFSFILNGCWVNLTAPNDLSQAPAGEVTIGTIPTKFRPKYGDIVIKVQNSPDNRWIKIRTDGSVNIYNSSEVTGVMNWAVNGTYPNT